jgi:hypothetical protein
MLPPRMTPSSMRQTFVVSPSQPLKVLPSNKGAGAAFASTEANNSVEKNKVGVFTEVRDRLGGRDNTPLHRLISTRFKKSARYGRVEMFALSS